MLNRRRARYGPCHPRLIIPGSFLTDVALDFLAAHRYAFDYQMMTRLFLLTIFLLHSGPIYAGWLAVEKQYQPIGLETLYFEPETIQ